MADTRRVSIVLTEGDKTLEVSVESYAEGWERKSFPYLLDTAYDSMQAQMLVAGIE